MGEFVRGIYRTFLDRALTQSVVAISVMLMSVSTQANERKSPPRPPSAASRGHAWGSLGCRIWRRVDE